MLGVKDVHRQDALEFSTLRIKAKGADIHLHFLGDDFGNAVHDAQFIVAG